MAKFSEMCSFVLILNLFLFDVVILLIMLIWDNCNECHSTSDTTTTTSVPFINSSMIQNLSRTSSSNINSSVEEEAYHYGY